MDLLLSATKCDLAADVIREFGELRLKVTGTSMMPSVRPGDILTIRRSSAAELLPGRIVLCYRHQSLLAHRLVGKLGDYLFTRGDSLQFNDSPFHEDELLGEVVAIVRNGRTIAPKQTWWHRVASGLARDSELFAHALLRLHEVMNPDSLPEAG
jgi:signal peptidase I